MYYILYQTTNTVNAEIDVGVHSTDNLDDGYLGSGAILKKAIKKYGKKSFIREILAEFTNAEEMNLAERVMVNIQFVTRRDTYNQEIGGRGGKLWSEYDKKKMSDIIKQQFEQGREVWNKGKICPNSLTTLQLDELSHRMKGENNPMFGKNVKDIIGEERDIKRREKISSANKKPKTTVEGYKQYSSQRLWIVNKEGKLSHATSKEDSRILSGEWRLGRKWKYEFGDELGDYQESDFVDCSGDNLKGG